MVELIKEKLDLLKELEETPFPKAGVLIALKNFGEYKKDPHIIFTKRSSKLSSHPGEVSFPGGKFEEQDLNLLATAVRESEEEIGIKKSSAQLRKNYNPNQLINKQVIAVVNFAPKQIGKIISEVLVLALPDENNEPILVLPSKKLLNGVRLY